MCGECTLYVVKHSKSYVPNFNLAHGYMSGVWFILMGRPMKAILLMN